MMKNDQFIKTGQCLLPRSNQDDLNSQERDRDSQTIPLACECLRLKELFQSSNPMEEVENEFCVCRKCRSLSGSFTSNNEIAFSIPRSRTYSRQTTISRKLTDDRVTVILEKEPNDSQATPSRGGIEEPKDLDDEPLILNEGYYGQDANEAKAHCHVKLFEGSNVKRARRKLIVSSILCLIFMLAEIVGGYLSNSLAIMTDAAHLLSDLTSFIISLFALWVGQKTPTKRMSFGYFRAEILGAVVSVLIIWILTGILVYMAVGRVINPDYEINSGIMIIVSSAGVAMNIVMGIVLHGVCGVSHGHSHGLGSGGETNGHSHENGSENINVRAAFIHVMGDLIQSLGVMIAAFIIRYKPEYKLADPICTFLFSVLVILTTFTIMKDAIYILMEGFPKNLNYGVMKADLQAIEGVKAAHSLHIWSLTIDKNAMSVHLATESDADPHDILQEAQMLAQKKYAIFQSTIQVEKYDADIMLECKNCLGPAL